MTKLEQKLIELGYEQDTQNQFIYFKLKRTCIIYARLNNEKNECRLYLDEIDPIYFEADFNNLKRVFKKMKKDEEVLWSINKERDLNDNK